MGRHKPQRKPLPTPQPLKVENNVAPSEDAPTKVHKGKTGASHGPAINLQGGGSNWIEKLMAVSTALSALAALGAIFAVLWQSREDRRAWVTVSQTTVAKLEPGKEITLNIIAKNYGKTPATDVRVSSRYVIAPGKLSKDKLADAGTEQEGAYLIPPDANMTIIPRFKTALTEVGVDAFNNGTGTLYVIGRITYSDIFGTRHETRFCFFARAERWQNGVMNSYEWGNTAN